MLAGRYELVEEIGRGGMGRVFRAHDRSLGRQVAIKSVNQTSATAVAEARAAAGLTHPGFARIYDSLELDGQTYLVMELVEGETLQRRIERVGRLRVDEAVSLASQVAVALADARRVGFVHGDIKPSNVLVTPDGHAKLVDFGVSRIGDPTVGSAEPIVGSPLYVAPEQLAGEAPSARTDVYQVGGLLYAALAGRPPFTSEDAEALVRERLARDPDPPSRLNPRVPPELDMLVMRALSRDPARRFASIAELHAALGQVSVGAADETQAIAAPVSRERATTPALPGGFSWRVIAALAATLLAIAAFLAVVTRESGPAPFCEPDERPRFQGRLAELKERVGKAMGDPLECTHVNAQSGDINQATSKGLAYVRSASGIPAFTNGWDHWALTSRGLLHWTGEAVDPPAGAEPVQRAEETRDKGGVIPKGRKP